MFLTDVFTIISTIVSVVCVVWCIGLGLFVLVRHFYLKFKVKKQLKEDEKDVKKREEADDDFKD